MIQLITRKNNFDFLRLAFAITVFVTHLYELSGFQELKVIPITISYSFLTSGRAVQGFFIISGILIFMSYERSKSLANYAKKRIRRLYPGYIMNIIIIFLLLSIVSDYSLLKYLLHPESREFVFHNLLFLNDRWDLPGVFKLNKLSAVNGALWTLQLELLFYMFVPVVAWFGRRIGNLRILFLVYIVSSIYMTWLISNGQQAEALKFPSQLSYFMAGALCYYCIEIISKYRFIFLGLAILILTINRLEIGINLLFIEPLALAVCVIFFACFLPYFGNFMKYGDFSYGIYIYHFPLIQLLLALKTDWSPYKLLLISSLIVLGSAIASWHIVEKRFLMPSTRSKLKKDNLNNTIELAAP